MELLIIAAATGGFIGVARIIDRSKPSLHRLKGIPIVLVAVGVAALPFIFQARGPRMAKVRIPSAATLAIVSPAGGASVAKPFLNIEMRLTGAQLTLEESLALRPDRGHLHVAIDGRQTATWIGLKGPLDIEGFESGNHLLQIELVATDHGSFIPPVTAIAQFFIAGGN